ncbi:Monooxygenase FAD-binding [Penicillium soppii]|uniref:Monooxygenase FAD-binding n=1 Tax=Penicillium soppii TaxID=69789 RepID=UPI002548270B|nr:Monooxygenase FAD-binding [Penicillium soppii]KAJ5852713.1 Monooxygenase FAD-binding [Penicillium soppii]
MPELCGKRLLSKILICGGGVAGPALAFWLSRIGQKIVVVERSPTLRASGTQIDLRGQSIEVVKRLGLIDAIRSKLVDEAGLSIVDTDGNVKGTIPSIASRKTTKKSPPNSRTAHPQLSTFWPAQMVKAHKSDEPFYPQQQQTQTTRWAFTSPAGSCRA